MLRVRNILFPTDSSRTADRALPHALALAERIGATLHVLHAVVLHAADPGDEDHRFPDLTEFWRRLDARVETRLGEEDPGAGDAAE